MTLARRILLLIAFSLLPTQAAFSRELTDMAGDTVTLPTRIERVATVGPIPVLNSLVFAVGARSRIVNGLGRFAKMRRWNYQTVFAPHIVALPSLQNADYTPDLEALLHLAPDVVLTMDRASAESLRRAGLPALYVAWRQPEDVKTAVRLLGEVFSLQANAERYATYFDETLAGIAATLHRTTPNKPRVLYFSPTTLTQPHLIAEWWIRTAGGESVTDDGRSVESRSFTLEQLLAWDPDILIVSGYEEAKSVRSEPRFASLKAVRAGRVLVAPCGAHTWGNRTSEQPLMVLWAAKQFHPTRFANVDLVAETRRFYQDIFGVAVSAAQASEILDGGPNNRRLPN